MGPKFYPIPDRKGYYLDSEGNAYSAWVKGSRGKSLGDPQKLSGSTMINGGHISISLGKGYTEYLHRLVYLVFKGEIPDKIGVLHRDGNPKNNKPENLYLGDQKQNCFDMVKHGTCKLAKLNDEDVVHIMSLRGQVMVKDIAAIYSVRRQTISDIHMGNSFKHITRGVV